MDYEAFYRHRPVMITGGVGFIGSNLAHRLVELGANVLLVDSLIPAYGGNLFNIRGHRGSGPGEHRRRAPGKHHETTWSGTSTSSSTSPARSATSTACGTPTRISRSTAGSQLSMLEACRRNNPGSQGGVRRHAPGVRQARVPAGDRAAPGAADRRERDQQGRPGEYYHLVYNHVFGVRGCSLRLTNIYGPRQLVKHNRQGFIGWFIRLAVEDREFQIYGDGSQLRDFVFVDDAADAFLRAGASDACNGEVFNVGGLEPVSHRDLVHLLIEVAGSGRVARTSTGPRRRRPSTSAASTPIRAASAPSPAGQPQVGLREGFEPDGGATTGSTFRTTSIPRLRSGACIMTTPRVRFMHLQPAEDGPGVDAAIRRVVDRGWYVLGPEVEAFEQAFAEACGAAHAVGVGTGTDAIAIVLRGLGIGHGDEVITTPLSAAYTALACMMVGARPVFADVDPRRLTIDPAAIEAAITPRRRPSSRCTCTASRPTCPRSWRLPRATRLPSSRTAARPTWRPAGTAGRQLRRGGRLQLLPHQEPRRARRRRGRHDQRRRSGREDEADPQRRADRSVPSRRDGREQPPRRDAGGDPLGAIAVPAGVDRGSADARRGCTGQTGVDGAPGRGAVRVRSGPRLPPVPRALGRNAITCGLAARAGHRDADSLPRPDPAPAGGADASGPPTARWPTGSAHGSCRSRCTPACRRADVRHGRRRPSAGASGRGPAFSEVGGDR